jgi:hypothetical protein
VIESTIVNEWKAEARREGRQEGAREMAATAVLRCLRVRFGPVPEDVTRSVNTCTDVARLEGFHDTALAAASLDDFRRIAGI